MKELLQQKLEQLKIKLKTINTSWFDRFFDMLDKVEIDEQTIIETMDFAFSDEMVRGYRMGGYYNIFNKNQKTKSIIENFFKYLSDMAENLGKEKFKEFLKNSLKQIKVDYAEYLKGKHSAPTNFFNLFMRNLVIANPQDVEMKHMGAKIENLSNENEGRIDVLLGGVSIGHLEYDQMESNTPLLSFFEFRTLPGLERLGLGTYMFSEFCREVVEKRPDYAVLACNVAKDKDGSKTYSAWGAYPVNTTFSNMDERIVDTIPITQEEYKNRPGPFIYYFSPSVVKKCAENQVRYPRPDTALTI